MNATVVPASYRVVRWGRLSGLVRARLLLVVSLLIAASLGLALWALASGSLDIPPGLVLATLADPARATAEQRFVVLDIRLPRVLIALLAGAMLGMAGAAMQSVTRNSLADPGLIGVKEGASIAILTVIFCLPALDLFWRPLIGMIGGLGVGAIVVIIARDMSRARFVLVGIGLSWLLAAGISLFLTTADIRDVEVAMVWIAGSLHLAAWPSFYAVLGWAILGAVLLYASARAADISALGDAAAIGLGVRQRSFSLLRFIAPILLTAASVATIGNLGFVGLIAPHLARFVVGGSHAGQLSVSALMGALMVLIADTIGRLAFAPLQIPAGIVMTVVGVPFFLALLWQRRDQL